MENKLVSAVVVFFVLLFVYAKFGPAVPFAVTQVTTTKPEPFSVSASGKVTAVPDIAQVNLGFSTSGSTVSQVQNQANKTMNDISNAIKKLGISEKDIQTSNYNLRPDAEKHTYIIDINLEVKVRDFDKINQVIDAATANGANQIGGLNFTLDDAEKFRSSARKIAIENAKKKASQIASDAGIKLGKLINVIESSNDVPRVYMMDKAMGAGSPTGTVIEPGQSEISSAVTLQYETR